MESKVPKLRSNLVANIALVLMALTLIWMGRILYLADRGYQSPELTRIAQPIVDAMNIAKAESLQCSSFDDVVLEIEGHMFRLPRNVEEDGCPLGSRLEINEDRTVRIQPLLGIQKIDIRLIEDDFKSKSVSDRQKQFEHMAAQVQAKAAEIQKKKAEWEAREQKRAEEARIARLTWDQPNK